jgi:hypothetical protein
MEADGQEQALLVKALLVLAPCCPHKQHALAPVTRPLSATVPAGKTGCGGSVLHCLGELVDSEGISEECRSELLYYQRMRVRSFG